MGEDFKRQVAVNLLVVVAALLFSAFCLVIFKWCFVKYNKRKYKKIPSSYKPYHISEKSTNKWSTAFTYESTEHVQPRAQDMDYIIEPCQDLGKLQLELTCSQEELKLNVEQAKGIIAKTDIETSQVYASIYFYKDVNKREESEKQTDQIPMVYEPEFRNEFRFKITEHDVIQEMMLEVVLTEVDRYSKKHVIGEVILNMKEIKMDSSTTQWYDIQQEKLKTPYVGDLLLSLNYFPTAERLTMVVMKARNLSIKETNGVWGPFVKIFLLRKNGKRVSKKRTAMQKKTTSPVYNEAFTFNITNDALNHVGFKVVVTSKTAHGRDEIIGDVNVGANVIGSGLSHWNHMSSSLRKPVAMWHPLSVVGD